MNNIQQHINQQQQTKATKDGMDWLILALDPFHDYERTIEGLPDETVSRSNVRIHNQTATVSATADGDNFNIMWNGYHGYSIVHASNNLTLDSTPNGTFAPFKVLRSADGIYPSLTAQYSGTAEEKLGWGTVPLAANANQASRLIGVAFEIRDVTPALYQKGQYVANALPNHCSKTCPLIQTLGPPEVRTLMPSASVTAPFAVSQADMQAYPNAVTRELKAGAYVIPHMGVPAQAQRLTSPTGQLVYTSVCIQSEIIGGALQQQVTCGADNTTGVQARNKNYVYSGFSPCQMLISGVAAETVLQITFRTIVEYYPDLHDPQSLSTATDTAAYDPYALQLYHEICRKVPFCVPVKDNASGDYFRKVKSVMSRLAPYALRLAEIGAPIVMSALGVPQLGMPLANLARVGRNTVTNRRVKRKKTEGLRITTKRVPGR